MFAAAQSPMVRLGNSVRDMLLAVLRSLCRNLLDQIESHALAALPGSDQPPAEHLAARHARHAALVDALERRDRDGALSLLAQHNQANQRKGC